ncbi:hypothetical protein BMW23_0377 [Bodo saltans virus]|jgi:hypothetical protein|uniref:Transmembrane protein n=1 Tax=Bodo saltans virus TaxID=2024608 RepID=A0A2H4UU14_9VIRU|nr:hypothetical protein QJ851_gp0368 [Bodo saltans virus]ATZ80431.1 hypothetical protein BMW23_0377 [Bodo saltans virus]
MIDINKYYNDTIKYIFDNPVEIYIMWGILIIFIIMIIIYVYSKATCYDESFKYIQYYL